jgi:hypothetical protein
MDSAGSRSDWVSGTAAAVAGLGMVTLALFPLALPILALTIVATLPLAVPLIAIAAIAAILTVAALAIRAAGRGIRRLGRGRDRPDVVPAKANPAGRDPLRGAFGPAAATRPRPH